MSELDKYIQDYIEMVDKSDPGRPVAHPFVWITRKWINDKVNPKNYDIIDTGIMEILELTDPELYKIVRQGLLPMIEITNSVNGQGKLLSFEEMFHLIYVSSETAACWIDEHRNKG